MTETKIAKHLQDLTGQNDPKQLLAGVLSLSDRLHPKTPLTGATLQALGGFISYIADCAAAEFDKKKMDVTFEEAETTILSFDVIRAHAAFGKDADMENYILGKLRGLRPSNRLWERIFRILTDLKKRKFDEHFTESFEMIASHLKAYNDMVNRYHGIFFSRLQSYAKFGLNQAPLGMDQATLGLDRTADVSHETTDRLNRMTVYPNQEPAEPDEMAAGADQTTDDQYHL